MTEYAELIHNLEELDLIKIKSYIPEFLDENKKNSTILISALNKLTHLELEDKKYRISENLIRTAAFPFRKTLEDFDFTFNDSIDKEYIMDLATLRFAEDNKNILFLGNPGVGKTHLAVALGIKATQSKYSVYFTTCHQLISKLNKAQKENRVDKQLQHFAQYQIYKLQMIKRLYMKYMIHGSMLKMI